MNKSFLLFVLLFSIPVLVSAQQSGSGVGEVKAELLKEIETAADEQVLHEKLLQAAELLELTGELNRAADLYKQASLAIRGKKDFNALYRSAVLNVETDFLREAEADLRAIIMFSDDTPLRIKAGVLTSRIKNIQGMQQESKELLEDVLLTYEVLPAEAVRYAFEIFSDEEINAINSRRNEPIEADALHGVKPMPTPENIFKAYSGSPLVRVETEDEGESVSEVVVSIQLGSFSVLENAEELQKSVSAAGWEAAIKPKTVNGKEYFTVIVPVSDDQPVQTLVIRLKEKGFEGYPVY